jgi:hypothetical protein
MDSANSPGGLARIPPHENGVCLGQPARLRGCSSPARRPVVEPWATGVRSAMTRTRISIALFSLLLLLVCGKALGTPPESLRYPFDPACAWGRVSNGRGLLVRCLTRDESDRLSKSPAAGTAATGATSVADQAKADATPAPSMAGGTEPKSGQGGVRPANSEATANPATKDEPSKEPLSAELVSVIADEGELPLAKKKLGAPLDRYAKCVAEHGGLTASVGQVEVRFLVRERGRAEGVSLGKFQGMSEAAASCVAQVVDRRPTGTPEAPVVGATALIRVRKRAPASS